MTLRLTIENITKYIPKHFIGIYHLGTMSNDQFLIKYIGRSDTILKRRLLQHCRLQKYTHFAFFEMDTILDTFLHECREWHRIDGLDNKIHPDSPKKLPYECPYCNIKSEFKIIKP